ncbi:MAG: SIR2 family protein [Methanosarcina sp.]
MPRFSSLQIPPPSNSSKFESLCCDLWREIWEDPNTKKNGRRGQTQNGVDIYGRPHNGDLWSGIQCKCKNIDLNKNLTESEVKEEVRKAKNFEPKLSEFIIATTGPKDAKIEELARNITQEHLKESLFSVNIWGWEDIKDHLSLEIANRYYPDFNLVPQEDVNELISIIENSRVLFIGDELSKKSGVESFRIFILEIVQSITNHRFTEMEYDELSEKLHSESAFKILRDELGDNILVYFEDFIHHDPNRIHYYIADKIKNGKWVFTTNRDNLIEEAYKRQKYRPELIKIYDDFDFKQVNKNIENYHNSSIGRLFKLNGAIKEEEEEEISIRFKSILANLSRIGTISDDKKKVLEYFLKISDFCFIGFDCLDNFYFFPVLRDTDTDKSVYYLTDENKLQENIKIVRKKEELENEMGEKDIPRDIRTLCINNILLKRKEFSKITGNWIEILQNKLCHNLKINYYTNSGSTKTIDYSKEKKELSEKVDEYEKNIIFGLLWGECLIKERSVKFFDKARLISEIIYKEEFTKAINKARAVHNLAMVYDIQYGKSEQENVLNQYQNCFEIYYEIGTKYKSIQYRYKAIQCKLGLANYKRRALRELNDALNDCEEIKVMLEETDKEAKEMSGSKINYKEYYLIHAQYHSCVGLIYNTYGTEYINKCIDSLNRSLDYRKKAGDIKGEADSENSIGLIKGTNHNDDVKVLIDAISHLRNSLNINESIGNLIGAARNYRNLGLCYKDLIRLNEDEKIKKESFQQAKNYYKNGISYWYTIKGGPPIEDVLECKFRLGELEIKYGDYGDYADVIEGVEILQRVDEDYEKDKDYEKRGYWHNRTRVLNLLSEAYAKDKYSYTINEAKKNFDKIIDIYYSALKDKIKLKEQMKNNRKIFENAVETIENNKNVIKHIEANSISLGEFDKRTASLDRILEELRNIENDIHLEKKHQ